MEQVNTVRGRVASAENELAAIRAAAAHAEAELVAAASQPDRAAELPGLRAARAAARSAVTEHEARVTKVQAELAAAEQRQAAEDAQARLAAETEARRAAEEQARREHEARLAAPLDALARATQKATEANVAVAEAIGGRSRAPASTLVDLVLVARTPSERAEDAARVRASLAGEHLAAAAQVVEAIDAKHPAIRAAREQARAMTVHGVLADLAEPLALLDAARTLNAVAFERIAAVAAAHPNQRDVFGLALAAAMLDAARAPLPMHLGGSHAILWVGAGATEQEALEIAARGGGQPVPPRNVAGFIGAADHFGSVPHVPVAELGRLVLGGRVNEINVISAARATDTKLRALAMAVANYTGPVQRAHAAVEELAYSRASRCWNGDEAARTTELRGFIAEGAAFIAEQIREQIPKVGITGPFCIRSAPNLPQVTKIPEGRIERPNGAGWTSFPAHQQVLRYLGLEGTPEESLMPEIEPNAANAA